ncbi:Cation-transporting ATPase [Paramyrothecium foliicola]|nr:Cation-transporting ATPase [Paramyrothecium foliicola]
MEEGGSSYPRDSGEGPARPNGHAPLYRLNSNQSHASIFEDVEMAHEELFSGPVAESLPTSVSAFSHRRARADSTTSFTYYEDEPELPLDVDEETFSRPDISDEYTRRSVSDIGDLDFGDFDEEDSADHDYDDSRDDYVLHRRSSTHSRTSVHAHLLRTSSVATAASSHIAGRSSQKLYMANEDLTIAIAGFRTSLLGRVVYIVLCVCTLGVAYLLFRWIPRWYIALVGQASPLKECDWVVIENQWSELVVMPAKVRPYGRPLSTVFGLPDKLTADGLDDENDPIMDVLRTLDYRYVRLFFHPLKDKFILSSGWKDPDWTDIRRVRSGLDSDEKSIREIIFSNNLIDIEEKSLGHLLVDEVLHPFYIFQIASLVLWSLDSYYYYAACILIMSVGSISATLLETRATMRRLREVSRFECDVRVLRNGFWRYVSSGELVPGDIYELSDPNLTQFPADSILLSGDCIVNESMLTGESVPVSKLPANNETLSFMDLAASSVSPETARHFLFCGTKIIRTRRPQDDQDGDAVALALVVRTGFNTTKGALVRSMLFPKPSGFKFYRDSFRYISVMAVIAMVGFIASFINFVRLGIAWHLIIIRALDLITIVVPPALPATLTIGTNFALARLKKKQIFCISPQRVNVGGKLDIMCFDKTGTLTEDGLDVLGIRVVAQDSKRFSEVISEVGSLRLSGADSASNSTLRAALHTMATCHSLRSVEGELVGDPLDLKMFEFTTWSYEEGKQGSGEGGEDEEQGGLAPSIARSPDGALELGVLKSFEFVSQLRRASVIVRQFGQKSGDIFVKGAPEAMREICRPETFPKDYDEQLSYYTHKGYRVIGCATRHLKKLSWVKAQKMSRDEAESDLDFLGFIIFENKLKPTTAAVIKELLESNIGAVMVTGDNILTAISVARECGLVDRNAHCFVPHFAEGNARDPTARLQWESIDDSIYSLDPSTLIPYPAPPEGDASLPYDISNLRNYSLAISGEVFRWIVDYAPPEVMRRMLVCGKVFARMSPDEKHELVEKLQSIDYSCGFCGDGANDCGALKAADVGISLSEAEASVAAPFTSRVFDIRCVLEVIKEGRAALVTSFSCFKYMSLYSAIQFTSVSFLYAKASNLGDFQFLFIDLLLILPIAVFMGWAGPAPVLSRKRPTADLVSRKVLAPLLGLMGICVAVQAVAYVTVREQPWYIPPKIKHEESNIKNSENTALFLTSCFEYILSGVILNAGPPFRQGITQNYPFCLTIAGSLVVTVYMILKPAHRVKKIMQLTSMSLDYRFFLIGLGLVYVLLAWAYEKHVGMRIARALGHVKERLTGKAKQRKAYKQKKGMRHVEMHLKYLKNTQHMVWHLRHNLRVKRKVQWCSYLGTSS